LFTIEHKGEARMSAGFDIDVFREKGGDSSNRCSVVSIYEDQGGRDLLLNLCNSLVRKFKNDLEFQFDWWRFKYLADPGIAMDAAHKAVQADLILLAPQSPDLPAYVQGWFDGWLPNREATDGALVLVQSPKKGSSQSLSLPSYLRMTAKRAHLDYLRLSSGSGLSLFQPDLSELSGDDDRPMHWGINE
jgi:hypothetical protein